MILMNAGKGGSIYPKCKPFNVDKIMQHIRIYVLHGLAPSLQVKMEF